MDLKFTPYKKEYFKESAQLMSQTWAFNEGLENPRDDRLIYQIYFQYALLDSQYTDFIVDENGRVLGYLLASAPCLETPVSRLKGIMHSAWAHLNMIGHLALGDLGTRKKAWEMMQAVDEMEEISYKDTDHFDAEVVLFFLSDELRGQGCGRKLMERYYDFCRSNNIRNIFLITDLGCNVGFYDHNGFTRYREFHHEILSCPEQQYNGFVYTKVVH